jgi:hypothetical protein
MDNLFRTWNYLPTCLDVVAQAVRKIPSCLTCLCVKIKLTLRGKKCLKIHPQEQKTDSEKKNDTPNSELDLNMIALNRFFLFLMTNIVFIFNTMIWSVIANLKK